MELDLPYPRLVAFFLVLVRAIAWLQVVPPFNDRKIVGPMVTMCIGSGLAILIAPSVPASMIPQTTPGYIAAVVAQVLTGVAMGLVVNLLISAITSAGSLVDVMGGLNLPPAVDPLGLDQTPMLGQFYQQVALLLFFVSGSYLLVIEGFARSFSAPGFTLDSSRGVATVLVTDLATYFSSAVEIAAPLLIVLFAAQVVLAVLSKAAPQMNVWVLGMPFQIFLALGLVAIGISVLPSDVDHLVTRALGDAGSMFGGR